MESFTLPSFAKINLMLRVLGKCSDGFHGLFTVFQTVSLHDELTFSDGDRLDLTCNDPRVPTGGHNLIVRAARLLAARSGVRCGAAVHLDKRIPSPGGLGGGSSNAAVALIGLSRLWDLNVPFEENVSMAEELGSDVPFFLYGGTAIGTGRGTEIEQTDDVEGKYLIIVTPDVRVSTREAFDLLKAPSLTMKDVESILIVCRFEALRLDLGRSELFNDIERVAFAAYPEIERVKSTLLEIGALNAMMSGSGASVFAVFDKEETRQAALNALDDEVNWRKFAVAAVSRAEYRERLGLAD
ncbi:MAG: 4-(cytidine 5'-diphospho)-2-C-methyl-D-erythritol kinase [Pyrinomonadaceae bacterium]